MMNNALQAYPMLIEELRLTDLLLYRYQKKHLDNIDVIAASCARHCELAKEDVF